MKLSTRAILLLVAGSTLLVLLLTGGGLGWRAWTHSPTYSLKQLLAGVERRDRYELEKYVDIDALLQAAISDTTEGNPLAGALGNGMITTLKAQLIRVVEDGSVAKDSQFGKGFQNLRDPGFELKIARQDRNAYFSVPIMTNGGAPFSLQFHMTQVPDGHWRIDRLANLKELRAAEAEEERVRKAAIAKANEEKLLKLHVVAGLHTSVKTGWGGWERKNHFQIRLENKSDKTVAGMTGHIRFPTQDFNEGIRGKLRLEPGAADTYEWEFDVNRFIESTERVFALGETDVFQVEIESITYADSTTVKRGSEGLP